MKIIHCADLHLGSKIEGLPADKSRIRREEIIGSFERLVVFAKENGVSVVIIAGDAFDTEKVSVKTRERFFSAVKNAPTVDFLFLAGNHDREILKGEEELPKNLKVFGDDWTYYNYGEVTICGVRFNGRNEETIYDTLSLDAGRKNIVVLHGQVAGYISKDPAEIISIPRLKGKNIDYLALGHIHSYGENKIDFRGRYAYSGTLDGRGFDEAGDKGFVLLDTDGKGVSSAFFKASSRDIAVEEFRVDCTDTRADIHQKIVDALQAKYSADTIVKVEIKGEHNADTDIDAKGLSDRLNALFFFAKVQDKTELKVKESDFEHDKSIKGFFVREVLENRLEKSIENEVIMCGIKALEGEDL